MKKDIPSEDVPSGKINDSLKDSEIPSFDTIKDELELQQRTQVPPSEELIARLNKKASQPPFSFIHKKKDINIY
jgi:hypothetical protein